MTEPIQAWLSEIVGPAASVSIEVKEEPHCPDPTCPLRHTVLIWKDQNGEAHRAVIVKPFAYVRRDDVARALRLFTAKG